MRTFESSVLRWPGKILTGDFLRWPELEKWETALKEAQKLNADGESGSVVQFYSILLPVALSVIKEWKIEGLPEKIESVESLPASTEFVAFIVDCISKLFQETNTIDPQ